MESICASVTNGVASTTDVLFLELTSFRQSGTPEVEIKDLFKNIAFVANPSDHLQEDIDTYIDALVTKYATRNYERKIPVEQFEQSLKKVVLTDVNYLYCVITYPLNNEAVLRFAIPDNTILNVATILYLYTYAYQKVYKIEEQDLNTPVGTVAPSMLNRAQSNGMYGIWGHNITDLVYNGFGKVYQYTEKNCAVCILSCDS
jgi:hypothetical protein